MIGVPTGVKIFNWMATLWAGAIKVNTALLFAVGFVGMFTIGGLSGVTHSMVPSDYQQQDTYYIVAHFHYVLFGGAIFALFGGAYYWFPKFTGKLMNEGLGQLNFWTLLVGFNLTFFPMHMSGLLGMPRRIYTYSEGQGWDLWNLMATVGAFVIAFSVSVFLVNLILSLIRGDKSGDDPWDARTLEWSLPSPVPHYNFAEIPQVHARDEFWHRKYTEDEAGRAIPVIAGGSDGGEEHDGHGIHMPSPSYFPLIASSGFPFIATGLIYDYALVPVGAALLVVGLYGWAMEPATEESD
jgi:cytochrome c oxidase subunit 1